MIGNTNDDISIVLLKSSVVVNTIGSISNNSIISDNDNNIEIISNNNNNITHITSAKRHRLNWIALGLMTTDDHISTIN